MVINLHLIKLDVTRSLESSSLGGGDEAPQCPTKYTHVTFPQQYNKGELRSII